MMHMLFDWNKMDTSGVENLSDEIILAKLRTMDVVFLPGYGIVAELCKRYESITKMLADNDEYQELANEREIRYQDKREKMFAAFQAKKETR